MMRPLFPEYSILLLDCNFPNSKHTLSLRPPGSRLRHSLTANHSMSEGTLTDFSSPQLLKKTMDSDLQASQLIGLFVKF